MILVSNVEDRKFLEVILVLEETIINYYIILISDLKRKI